MTRNTPAVHVQQKVPIVFAYNGDIINLFSRYSLSAFVI